MTDDEPLTRENALGVRLKELRESRGWTQAQLATRAKVERSTIQNVESGRVRRPNTLPHIADALGVTVEDLTGESIVDPDSLDALEGMLEAALAELYRLKRERQNPGVGTFELQDHEVFRSGPERRNA
jgi:HTH-type transcriptional regulator / antitoxin HipB